ncbi:AAA family ATPase [Microbacterium sp. H83]|uniref:AAA family ATPase n=1 Tax=Microbacterium sp. H83 TaxID=1827324 RepID=UPI0007F4A0BE|nr:hypothetical protein [Microbacterium sp. H83]OAN43561.1 hypothetical protein A4X16_01415 [Microbacterium sp. H83]
MTAVVVALPEPRASHLATELEIEGLHVIAVVRPDGILPLPEGAQALVVPADRSVLAPALITMCDRAGVRIVPVGHGESRLLARYGLPPALPEGATGWEVAAMLSADVRSSPSATASAPHGVTVVWGPQGAPGRSTLAIQLSVELARAGRRTALVDADTVAPSLALLLGLGDEAPGIAAACRRAEIGALDATELSRLSTTIETGAGAVEVLGGINRPSRWPELSATRLRSALQVCRTWAEETVVDVASAFDADDEATYDLTGPRRHAATVSALQEADAIIAVASADPLGISRFLRDHAELRRLSVSTPVRVVVNRLRPGPLGLDARGQIRRTLDRFAGITDVTFVPLDQRAADAALLHARPMADVTPRSSFVAAVRTLVSSRPVPTPSATGDSSPGNSRGARRLLRAPAARAE